MVAEKNFIGINVRTYSFIPALDTLAAIVLDFESVGGIEEVTNEKEFSQAIVFPLSDAQASNVLRITASVELHSNESMEGVAFVISTEKDGFKHDYRALDVSAAGNSSESISFTERFNLSEFDKDWTVKVYVWNPAKRQFQMDNLKLMVEN